MHWENDDPAYFKNFSEIVMPDGITKYAGTMNQDHHMSSEGESSKSF